MEVSMHLAQAVNTILQAPSPVNTLLFDFSQQSSINDVALGGITVDKSHDALGVPDQISNSPDI
jgi:hypothetical protein